MLFANAFRTLRSAGRRAFSTAEATTTGSGALVAAVGTTFGTYMLADFFSNFLQHPTQLVRVANSSNLPGKRRFTHTCCLSTTTDGLWLL